MSKVLLVEDSATQAMEIRLLLEDQEHQVTHVADGQAAMETLGRDTPDVVVTDLEMPHMTGLELVEQMQVDFPHVPAILVTGKGSESLAVQALRRGAAAYVPKNLLSSLLHITIRDVLGVLRADQSYARLIETLTYNQFTFRLPSEPFLIPPLVDLVLQIAAGVNQLSSVDIVRLSSALDHAIQNGMLYGNLELSREEVAICRQAMGEGIEPDLLITRRSQSPYQQRRLDVDVQVNPTEFRCRLRDEGPGFDYARWTSSDEPTLLEDEDGRGLVLIHSFMDDVQYNDRGNEVTLVKRAAPPAA